MLTTNKIIFYSLRIILGCLTVAPFVILANYWHIIDSNQWSHLLSFKFPQAFTTTLWVSLLGTIGSLTLGAFFAFLLAFFRWPYHKFIFVLVLTPMALPPYVISFLWTDFFLKNDIGLFEFRSIWGAAWTFSLSLYPYIFILCYLAFKSLQRTWLEAASSMGLNQKKSFFRITLPLSWPWVISGCLLVIFEILSDFGAVSQLGVETLSVLAYRTWAGLQDLNTAIQLASTICLFSAVLLVLRHFNETNIKKYSHQQKRQTLAKIPEGVEWVLLIPLWVLLFLTTVFPILQLVNLTARAQAEISLAITTLIKSLTLSLTVALVSLSFSALLIASGHLARRRLHFLDKFHLILYGTPGAILGILMLGLFYQTSAWGLAAGSGLGLALALFIKFNGVALSQIESSEARIPYSLDETATLMGQNLRQRLGLHLVTNKKALAGSFLFITIEVLREMPLTLILRPLGWDTLAIKIYQYTSEGLWAPAAPYSLLLVLFGFLICFYLLRTIYEQ